MRSSVGTHVCPLTAGNVDVEGAEVSVEPCLAAVAAGDGRELWQSLPNGQISNVMGKKCLGLRDNAVSDGGSVVLMDCDQAAKAGDGSSIWETQGSGVATKKGSVAKGSELTFSFLCQGN